MEALCDLVSIINSRFDLERMASDALDGILSFMKADAGVIYKVDETGIVLPVTFRNLSRRACDDLSQQPVKVGECLCGKIAGSGSEIVIRDKASADHRASRKSIQEEGMEFYAGLPIMSAGRAVGVLCVITHEQYDLDSIGLPVLRQITGPLGIAMENSMLMNKIRNDSETLRHENIRLRNMVGPGAPGVIGQSPVMAEVHKLIQQVAGTDAPALITGESGSGKELAANAIHNLSGRKHGPFIALNCGALSESLLESELFGHEKGSFTDAYSSHRGYLEQADGGTLFLDEVHLLTHKAQIKLLRALQEKMVYKMGSEKPVPTKFRLIAASNRPLEDALREGTFREDLYYRLNVVQIEIPPLRQRVEDIPALVCHFAKRFAKNLKKPVNSVSPKTMDLLQKHSWPGNVRELQNAMERAVIVSSGGVIKPTDLSPNIRKSTPKGKQDANSHHPMRLEELEARHITRVLEVTRGDKRQAARILGIHPTTLWRKLRKMQQEVLLSAIN